jgi:hypothetical protein
MTPTIVPSSIRRCLGSQSLCASASDGAGRQLATEELRPALDDRGRRQTERLRDDARPAGEGALVGRLELVADAAVGHDAVHARQQLAAVHDQPLEIRRRQLASERVERAARQEALDRERQQRAVMVHVRDTEHVRRRHAHRAPAP